MATDTPMRTRRSLLKRDVVHPTPRLCPTPHAMPPDGQPRDLAVPRALRDQRAGGGPAHQSGRGGNRHGAQVGRRGAAGARLGMTLVRRHDGNDTACTACLTPALRSPAFAADHPHRVVLPLSSIPSPYRLLPQVLPDSAAARLHARPPRQPGGGRVPLHLLPPGEAPLHADRLLRPPLDQRVHAGWVRTTGKVRASN